MTHILQYQAVITSLPSAFRFESPPDDSRIVGNPEVMPPIFRKIQAAAVGRTGRSVPVLFQFANPNIAVADWVIVVLHGERQLLRPGGVWRPHVVAGGAGQLDVVLDQHAVVKRGDVRWA